MITRSLTGGVGILAAMLCFPALGQSDARPTFARIVEQRFEAWDLDHDGSLSAAEIDGLCVNAEIRGPEAAAAATLKRIVRSERFELPALSKAYLTTTPSKSSRPRDDARPEDGDADDVTDADSRPDTAQEGTEPAPPRAPNWQGAFRQSLSRIEHSSRQLFDSDSLPSIDHAHQGPLGDCSFVATVGAAVNRDPRAVASMITPRPDDEGGGYTVRFGTGRAVVVAPLSDSEIAISSTTSDRSGDDGLWLAVLEKAFGMMRREDRPEKYDTVAATDAIAQGMSPRATIRLLTGNSTDQIALRRRATDPAAEDAAPKPRRERMPRRAGDPPGPSLVLADDAEVLAAKVRESVSEALTAQRLVTLVTADETLPPGISRRHAYAVLAYDAKGDTLSIWNPHGNTFPVSGRRMTDAGLENGYPTRAGIFSVPVTEIAKIFRGVIIESQSK